MNERVIVGSGVIVALTGTVVALNNDGNVPWRVIGGALGIMILLSLIAATGEGPAKIASGLAVVTATGVVMSQAVPLFNTVTSLGKENPQ